MVKNLDFKISGVIKVLVLSLVLASSVSAAVPASKTVVVTPSNPHDWFFVNDQTDGPGSGSLTQGPMATPLGLGSAIFDLGNLEAASQCRHRARRDRVTRS